MKVLLLDGYNLIYRARYSFAKGPNSTIFSFFRSLRPIIEKFSPDKVYFVTEGYPAQRMQLLPEYKGTREYHDKDDFQRQKHYIIDTLKESFPIHVVRHPEHECDDVIGSLVLNTHAGDDCVVVSTDSDFIQLYNACSNVSIYNPVRKEFVDQPSYDYVSWKSLRGDAADNIIGFRGIGDKRALALIQDDGALDKFLDKDQNREMFDRNHKLIKFFDLSEEMHALERSGPVTNWDEVRKKFTDLEFFAMTNSRSWKKYIETFQCL